ncbi:MAG TPA: EpsG family protein [Rudaea sp.]|uniref:EpsG family protein n=1 Tax=Rudaea sp. TaxID=2136325 RepID=UPI002F9214CB
MLIYWLMFWLPFLGAISPKRMINSQARFMFLLVCLIFTIFMGLRDMVGGDWTNYLPLFGYISTLNFAWAIELKDPGYALLNWIVAKAGGEIYSVNLVCAAIMMAGAFRFCRSLPNPWLALLVAVPYMLIVVGMGYTRQAVALGFAMFGLVSLGRGRIFSFIACIAVGALFHSSAVLLIPIAGLANSRQRIWTAMWVAAAFVFAYFVLLQPESDALWDNYVTQQMKSNGAIERVMMNVVAAIPLLYFRKRLVEEPQTRRLWVLISWLALACLPFVFFASTAVDRIALYLLPIQLFVFARLPNLTGNATARTVIVVGIVAYYAAVQYVWLNYAVERNYWVPYHFMPLD